jgi:mono/diheme cytochrome c family protein
MIGRGHLALLGAAILAACTSQEVDPMERQPRYEAFGQSTFFADGRAMRTPPEGTVPRERLLGSRALLEGGSAESTAAAFPSEVKVDRVLFELGRSRFEIYCAACHGLAGDGDSIVARNMSLRPPPDLLAPPYSERTLGHYYRTITFGFGLMPSYAQELGTHERWAVVAYLKALQRSQNARLDDVPAEKRSELAKVPVVPQGEQ